MVDFSSILNTVHGAADGVLVQLGFFIALAGSGIAKVMDASTRRAQLKQKALAILPAKRARRIAGKGGDSRA